MGVTEGVDGEVVLLDGANRGPPQKVESRSTLVVGSGLGGENKNGEGKKKIREEKKKKEIRNHT